MSMPHGYRIPDPQGSPHEKIETPRYQWPIERFSELEALLREEGIDPELAAPLGRVFRRLGENIQLDVQANERAFEYWANIHTHPGGGSLGFGAPTSPAEFLYTTRHQKIFKYSAVNGNLLTVYTDPNEDIIGGNLVSDRNGFLYCGNVQNFISKFDHDLNPIWKVDISDNETSESRKGMTIPVDHSALYMVAREGTGDGGWLFIIDFDDGSLLEKKKIITGEELNQPHHLSINRNNVLYVTPSSTSLANRKVLRLDPPYDSIVWEYQKEQSTGSNAITPSHLLNGDVFSMKGRGEYILSEQDGSLIDFRDTTNDYSDPNPYFGWNPELRLDGTFFTLVAARFNPPGWLRHVDPTGGQIDLIRDFKFENDRPGALAEDNFYVYCFEQGSSGEEGIVYKMNSEDFTVEDTFTLIAGWSVGIATEYGTVEHGFWG